MLFTNETFSNCQYMTIFRESLYSKYKILDMGWNNSEFVK